MSKKSYPQIGVRIPQELMDLIDELVEQKEVKSKSIFVREAIDTLLYFKGKIDDPPASMSKQLRLDLVFPENRIKYIEKIINSPIIQYNEGHKDVNDFIRYAVNLTLDEYEWYANHFETMYYIYTEAGIEVLLKWLIFKYSFEDQGGITTLIQNFHPDIEVMKTIYQIEISEEPSDVFEKIQDQFVAEGIFKDIKDSNLVNNDRVRGIMKLDKYEFIKKVQAGEI